MSDQLWPALCGVLLGLSLYSSIGPQNLFILRHGMAGRHVFTACGVSALADTLLVVIGMAGLGPFLLGMPRVTQAASLFAALFIGWLGLEALQRFRMAGRGTGETAVPQAGQRLRQVVLTALALSLLNPQAHAELILVVGSWAASYGVHGRIRFGMGVAAASFIWLFLLGYAAIRLQPLLVQPRVARLIDLTTAVILLTLAASQLLRVL